MTYDEDDQDIEEREQYDDVIQLITLHSDIIRNTREIDTSLKKHYITNSVNNYVGLMWEALDTFKDIVTNAGTDKIEEVLLFKKGDKGRQTATEELIRRMERIVFQIIPVSVIEYMSEHLENPKLKRPVRSILKEETVLGKKLFYALLLLTIDLDSGIDECKNLIHNSESYVVDHIIFIYSMIYSLEHKLEEGEVERILDLLDSIRKKYAEGRKDLRPLVRDTFRSNIRKMILLKTVRKEK